MDERRRYPRYALERVRGRLGGRHPFTALTVSRGGILVAVGMEPPLDRITDLEVFLEGAFFRSKARVVFVGEDFKARPEKRYRVGLEFVETSPADEEILLAFLHNRPE